MSHKFDPKNKHKLDNERRRQMLPPYETLIELGVKKGNTIADIGCGIGYFSFPACEIVEKDARVYAMDVSFEMIEYVEDKAKEAGISNIRAIKVDEYDFKTENGLFDFVLVSNVLHEVDNKADFVNEVKRILKPGGKFALIEWKKIRTDFGPPIDHRLGPDEIENLLDESGVDIEKTLEFGSDYYAVVGIKNL